MEKILVEAPVKKQKAAGKNNLRVAAYCRVSTDSDEQLTSYEVQRKVYRKKIDANPEWEYAGIYADEGVTGTSVAHREGFKDMIRDCEEGKIDLILTKSISRFARNTLECLTYIKYLKGRGVHLIFEKERIDTRESYSEMLLTILAAFAQEESRSISENIKWGIRKRYEKGIDRWTNIYGYTANETETYVIVEEEAKVVRTIFSLYERGKSMAGIRDYLLENHIPSPGNGKEWETSTIMRMLRNEKYAGDILLQKVYNEDHISHRKVKNDMTQIPAYYIENHHKPIVDRKTYNRVRKIRELNCQGGKNGEEGRPVQYPFADLLVCPYCGERLRQRKLKIQDHSRGWRCDTCRRFILKSRLVEEAVLRAAAEKGLEEKTVEYCWLDDLVKRIEFGKHEQETDRTVTVFWKDESQTTVASGVKQKSQSPAYLAQLYEKYLERRDTRADNPN